MIPASPLTELLRALEAGETTPVNVAEDVARHANGNASRNTYLRFDAEELKHQAEALEAAYPDGAKRPPLYGVPISLKDCFDLAGAVTTCGSRFYAEHHEPATEDSGMAKRLKAAGALITGKTHLHPLAYGITGQNPEYGDCLQPRDAALLTGGSSSGAVASVQEGSALAAIGTDTGGSVRVPAALGGLVGYRASHSLAATDGVWPAAWDGAAHLAASFDTVGILLRDARDAGPIARAVFGVADGEAWTAARVGCVGPAFLTDCDADVMVSYEGWLKVLGDASATVTEFDASWWGDSPAIFAPIQASEAAELHRGRYDQFEASIQQRLEWGASLRSEEVTGLRERMAGFRARMAKLFESFDLLVMPCAPVSRLVAADDQSSARQRILRYTTPFSLTGVPVVAMPGERIGGPFGTGVQMAAAPGQDGPLLAFVAKLAEAVPAGQW